MQPMAGAFNVCTEKESGRRGSEAELFKTGFGGVRRSFMNLATVKDALSFRKI